MSLQKTFYNILFLFLFSIAAHGQIPGVQITGDNERAIQMIENDLRAVFAIRGDGKSSRLHQEIFGGPVDGKLYYNLFLKYAKRIRVTGKPECQGGAAAEYRSHGDPSGRGRGQTEDILVCRGFFDIPTTTLVTAAAIVHETRHFFYLHDTTCRGGTCDNRPEGAWGATVVFLKNIARHCLNCKPAEMPFAEMQEQAESVADYIIQNNISNPEHQRILQQDAGPIQYGVPKQLGEGGGGNPNVGNPQDPRGRPQDSGNYPGNPPEAPRQPRSPSDPNQVPPWERPRTWERWYEDWKRWILDRGWGANF